MFLKASDYFYSFRFIFILSDICGDTLNASSGEIRSLDRNNDGLYDNKLDCHWTILSGPNQLIQLDIVSIQLEEEIWCAFDYLEVGIQCSRERIV